MVVLGAILLALAVLFVLGVLFTNGAHTSFNVFGIDLSHISVWGVFVAGLVTGVVALIGISLLVGGGARKRRKHVENKRVRSTASDAQDLAEQNAALRSELDRTRQEG